MIRLSPTADKVEKADFNFGLKILEHVARLEWYITALSLQISTYISQNINPVTEIYQLHKLLTHYYYRLRSVTYDGRTLGLGDAYFEAMNKMFISWKNRKDKHEFYPSKLIEFYEEFFRWLLDRRQKVLGIGIPTSKKYDAKERLKIAIQ